MNHFPIHTLDLKTRLELDKLAYDQEDFDKETLEGSAFQEFYDDLTFMLDGHEVKAGLNNEQHSLELLMLKYDTKVLYELMESYRMELEGTFLDLKQISARLMKYEIALRYRYSLGLYDTDESLTDYRARKIAELENRKVHLVLKATRHFTLPTISIPVDQVSDDSRTTYVDTLLETMDAMVYEHQYFDTARDELKYQLSAIDLRTKYDWSPQKKGWRLGYLEQRAIQAELILHLKNGLREAMLIGDEIAIRKYIACLNTVYYVNLVVSGIEPEKKPYEMPAVDYLDASYINTGVLGTSMYEAGKSYAENVRMLGTRGHGIAAEMANDLIDKATLKKAELLGSDNAKNGADRIVNGELIQTKYWSTGGKSIKDCFSDDQFKYVADGKPMQIEVPKDQYEQALKSMKDRITRGDMKNLGITDPEQAAQIVRKGNISYKTAQRIAKAGTIEGISFDASKGAVTGLKTFGVSATISFASAIWKGENADEALGQAVKEGSSVFGRHVVQHVLTQQIGRTALEKSMRPATDYVVKNVLGSKTSAQIVNTFLRTASQKSIHGAAALNHLSKVFRGNMVTMAVTTAVMSSGSIYDVINGRISKSQLFKNIGTAGASVGGAALGATVGSVIPVVGTFIGGVIGGVIGGKASKKALDSMIEDDAIATLDDMKKLFVENIEELNLDREELNFIAGKIFDGKALPKELKLMYAANDREQYISDKMDPYIDVVLKSRPRILDVGDFVKSYQEKAV
ncbi:hypothetical protein KP77_28270 [Jeotgalibacillus alimentarius]|uniref:Uncharacterized protein n=1 Tax=Jeotgalibacillus alimentarius TaxID=135826 RepID=A0A0C2R8T9_9BACL|nr:hypothetical protein [Jeotgalibacillus alimentarius]KIL46700.1 hypothetical protein KP77_28270 [Jeotgalibacillus alimentarius]